MRERGCNSEHFQNSEFLDVSDRPICRKARSCAGSTQLRSTGYGIESRLPGAAQKGLEKGPRGCTRPANGALITSQPSPASRSCSCLSASREQVQPPQPGRLLVLHLGTPTETPPPPPAPPRVPPENAGLQINARLLTPPAGRARLYRSGSSPAAQPVDAADSQTASRGARHWPRPGGGPRAGRVSELWETRGGLGAPRKGTRQRAPAQERARGRQEPGAAEGRGAGCPGGQRGHGRRSGVPGAGSGGWGEGPGRGRGRGAGGRPRPTSLSGTHCGSSRPKGLPKARCSGTMRRPLEERTSFLASRRAATSEDMTPPQRSPAPAPSPRPEPRPTRAADSACAQSPRRARSACQSALGIRPMAAPSNPRKGTSPATLLSVTNRRRGPAQARPAPLGATETLDWSVSVHVSAASSLIGVSGAGRPALIGRGSCGGRDGAKRRVEPARGESCGAAAGNGGCREDWGDRRRGGRVEGR